MMDILFTHKETVSELTMREMYETNAHRSNVQYIAIVYIVLNSGVPWLGGTQESNPGSHFLLIE